MKTVNPGEVELVFIRDDGCYGKEVTFEAGEDISKVLKRIETVFLKDVLETSKGDK